MWKSIDNKQEVSDDGQVKYRGILQQEQIKDGVISVKFRYGKFTRQRPVHVIVAEAFLEKEDKSHRKVIHLDGDLTNNLVTNLKWVSDKEFHKNTGTNAGLQKEIRELRSINSQLNKKLEESREAFRLLSKRDQKEFIKIYKEIEKETPIEQLKRKLNEGDYSPEVFQLAQSIPQQIISSLNESDTELLNELMNCNI